MNAHAAILAAHAAILHDLAAAARALDAAAEADSSGPLSSARAEAARLGRVNADASPLFHRWRDTGRDPRPHELEALAAAVRGATAARSAATSALTLQRLGQSADDLHARAARELRDTTAALENIINGADRPAPSTGAATDHGYDYAEDARAAARAAARDAERARASKDGAASIMAAEAATMAAEAAERAAILARRMADAGAADDDMRDAATIAIYAMHAAGNAAHAAHMAA